MCEIIRLPSVQNWSLLFQTIRLRVSRNRKSHARFFSSNNIFTRGTTLTLLVQNLHNREPLKPKWIFLSYLEVYIYVMIVKWVHKGVIDDCDPGQFKRLSFYNFWIESRWINIISSNQLILKKYPYLVLLIFHAKFWHLFTENILLLYR